MDSKKRGDKVIAQLAGDAVAMNEASLARDFDEARFRARTIVCKAHAAGQFEVSLAAAEVVNALGANGTFPDIGYGASMLRLSEIIAAIMDRDP